ncbi:MAG: PEP-CTERM sorting domain-containing protein [Verrucomicrobiota bacterium]
MKKQILLAAALAMASSALAQTLPIYVAGDFNSWNAAGNVMTETSPGIWQVALTGLSVGRHEFKFTQGDWGWNYPGANSWLYTAPDGSITITYDSNTYADGWSSASQRIGLNVDPGNWTAAGDFEGWNNAAGNMTPLGGGIYMAQVTTPGDHLWKAVVTGTWDSISWDNRSVGTADWAFSVGAGQVANLYVNALTGVGKVDIINVPEPGTLAILGGGLAMLVAARKRN